MVARIKARLFQTAIFSSTKIVLMFNSLGPLDAFKRPKIFVFFPKKKKNWSDQNPDLLSRFV